VCYTCNLHVLGTFKMHKISRSHFVTEALLMLNFPGPSSEESVAVAQQNYLRISCKYTKLLKNASNRLQSVVNTAELEHLFLAFFIQEIAYLILQVSVKSSVLLLRMGCGNVLTTSH